MVANNQVIFPKREEDLFMNFWRSCGSPLMLNDGKANFFIFQGFAILQYRQ